MMVAEQQAPSIFADQVVATRIVMTIWCAKTNRRTGRVCGHKLIFVDTDDWERDMASRAELFCDSCKNAYTLADYLHLR